MTINHHDIAASVQRALRQAEVEQPPGISGQEIVERVREMAMRYVANGMRATVVEAATRAMVAHLGPCEADAAGVCQAHWRDAIDQCPVRQATSVLGDKGGVQ